MQKNTYQILPIVHIGDLLSLQNLIPKNFFTKPPTCFKKSPFRRKLEKLGIRRPSAYYNVISTIQNRGYVRLENGYFYAKKNL